jgi:hypothetical protein
MNKKKPEELTDTKKKTKKELADIENKKYILERIEGMRKNADLLYTENIIAVDGKNYSYKDFIDLVSPLLEEEEKECII